MTIKVYDVSPRQQKLLDTMWSKDTYAELERWMATLDEIARREVNTLLELCILAEADQYVESLDRYYQAEQLLHPFLKK